jgi:hypothetical protein
MADLHDLLLSVTARLTHDLDFAFTRTNGDLANRLRSKFALEEESVRKVSMIGLDEDGDIRVRFPLATCYISAGAITVVGWLTSAKLLEERGLDELSDTIEHVFAERTQFQRQEYDIRLLIYSRSVSQDDSDAALSKSCQVALQGMFPAESPPHLQKGRLLVEYQEGKFYDSLEFEASKDNEEVQLRYGRTGKAQDFDSFVEFLRAADLKGLVEYLKPFAAIFQKKVTMRSLGG